MLFSCYFMSNSLWPCGLQYARHPVLHHLPDLAQTHVHWVGDAIQSSFPLSSPSPPTFSLSQHHGLFQWVGSLHQVAKVLELQLQYQSFQWIFGLTSFRMDWLDLLAVQGTLKSLLQNHSSKASILWHSAFFMVQVLYNNKHQYLLNAWINKNVSTYIQQSICSCFLCFLEFGTKSHPNYDLLFPLQNQSNPTNLKFWTEELHTHTHTHTRTHTHTNILAASVLSVIINITENLSSISFC